MNRYLDVAPEVQQAVAEGRPVVALESTIISHGMPYPQNVETALNVEKIIRENGAVPATIAIIGGRLKAGLTPQEIDYLGKSGHAVTKASRRDLPILVAEGRDGATTVTTTMMIAHMAGIRIFATGGIGGVHRGAETTMDISADLEELAQTPVMVVCAGAKSILDLGLTLEYLETKGVPVIGYGTKELPAFYTRKSGFGVDYRLDSPEELMVWADEFMLEEVIQNYLSNAYHYVSDPGHIWIRAFRRDDGEVEISVRNTGNQIPEADLDQVWDKFYKVDKARTRSYGGSGIGLSIVKAIMNSHGGSCGVRNCEDGVEFWCRLKPKAEEASEVKPASD